MSVGGRRGVRRRAAALLVVSVVLGGCASEETDESREAASRAAPTTAAPPPSEAPEKKARTPAPEGPAKALIAKAFRKMQAAYERKDPRAVLRLTGPLSIDYLEKTQRAVATAGRAKIKKLSVWQKLVLTTLRTDLDEDDIARLSSRELLGYVFDYGLDYFPTARLPKGSIRMSGPRTAAVNIGRGMVWFRAVDGRWKVEVLGAFETMGLITKEFAEQEGHTVKQAILGLAEEFTKDVVPGDVWSKP